MSKKSKLSEALASLSTTLHQDVIQPGEMIRSLPIGKIGPGRYQPRTEFEPKTLQELADSIKAQGVVQPIVVRGVDDGYEIVAGERRWRAAKLAGLTEIPAAVRELSDSAAMAVALIENINRENLNAIEEAEGVARMVQELGLAEAVAALGKPKSWLSKRNTIAGVADSLREFAAAEGIKDTDALYELARLHKSEPDSADAFKKAWLAGEIPNNSLRAAVRAWRLEDAAPAPQSAAAEAVRSFEPAPAGNDPLDSYEDSPAAPRQERSSKPRDEAEDFGAIEGGRNPAEDSNVAGSEFPVVFEVEFDGSTLTLFTETATQRYVIESGAVLRLRELLNG